MQQEENIRNMQPDTTLPTVDKFDQIKARKNTIELEIIHLLSAFEEQFTDDITVSRLKIERDKEGFIFNVSILTLFK